MRINNINFDQFVSMGLILCIVGLIVFGNLIFPYITQDYCIITVTDKQIKTMPSNYGSNHQVYMIWGQT